ncbi:MAG: Cell division protein FtsA [Hyphomicrobiaceae bacterium hypho_1]
MVLSRSLRNDVVALLDIGSSKISCAILQRHHDKRTSSSQVIGFSQRRAEGIRSGMIVDFDRAEHAVRGVIGDAETNAKTRVKNVRVAYSSSQLSSNHFIANFKLETGRVRPEDIKRIIISARQYAERKGRKLIHLNIIHYTLDGEAGINNPVNMIGRWLCCQIHAITTTLTSLKNLESLIERCHLSVHDIVPASFTSATAVTTMDEQKLGVTCIDIGAYATKIAAILDNKFIYNDTISIGGSILTHDIAKALSISVAEAEEIKTLHGTVLYQNRVGDLDLSRWKSKANQLVIYKTSHGDRREISVVELSSILLSRTRRQLEFIKERLDKSVITREFTQNIVLTGGASKLNGLYDLAFEIFNRPVRIGNPLSFNGVPSEYQGPSLSTLAGLSVVDMKTEEMIYLNDVDTPLDELYIKRMEQWLRESF